MKPNMKDFESWELAIYALRQAIEDKEIKQQEIVDKTGINQPNVSRLLSMTYHCKLSTFCQVLDAIGMQIKLVEKPVKDK